MKPDVRRPLDQTKVSPQIRDTTGTSSAKTSCSSTLTSANAPEDALAASERHLKLIIDRFRRLRGRRGPMEAPSSSNQHYLHFIGLSADQASGWGWTTAVNPEDLNDLAATLVSVSCLQSYCAVLTPPRKLGAGCVQT